MNPTDKSTAKQNELIATLIEQYESLTHEFRSFRNSTDQNIKNIKEFAETSDRNRSKEIRDLAKTMEIKYDTETDQSQINAHLETAADNVTDDETDGPNTSQRPRAASSRAAIKPINNYNEDRGLEADKAIRTVETLPGQDDVGVEDFILSVRKARARCKASDRELLLDLILIEKITDNAKRNIRYLKINSFEDLYSCLRQHVLTPTTISNCRDKLKNLKQGATESVQSFNSRFRQQLNELNYAVQNENRTPTERRVAIDIEEREALKTYLLNLRYEIGQMVVSSDPKNLNLAQQLAADREQWLREANRVANRPKNQSHNITLVSKRTTTDSQPQTSAQLPSRPLDDRMKPKCPKCLRIGHTAEKCYSRNFPFASQGKIPPRVNQTTENPEEAYLELTAPPPEDYYQSYCNEETEEEPDSSSIPEQESTL
ncbi:uncharacterized protein LOC117213154 [Bombus bifarius]|uniref:Uncharacterized protein LOC117213154 n=1 Tax=Bombus bifarius TaxID=103933 RepID=A0A6P8NIW8_9HYME|nr:uncharacterized protein LOC117213154 [Bombus bifarius]